MRYPGRLATVTAEVAAGGKRIEPSVFPRAGAGLTWTAPARGGEITYSGKRLLPKWDHRFESFFSGEFVQWRLRRLQAKKAGPSRRFAGGLGRETGRSRYARTSLRRRRKCLLSMPSAGLGRVVVSGSAGANDYWPVASLTHFVVKLAFAAPLSFLSCATVSQDA